MKIEKEHSFTKLYELLTEKQRHKLKQSQYHLEKGFPSPEERAHELQRTTRLSGNFKNNVAVMPECKKDSNHLSATQ